jgi:hypothetical protein
MGCDISPTLLRQIAKDIVLTVEEMLKHRQAIFGDGKSMAFLPASPSPYSLTTIHTTSTI